MVEEIAVIRTPDATIPIRRYREISLAFLGTLILVGFPSWGDWWLAGAVMAMCVPAILALHRPQPRSRSGWPSFTELAEDFSHLADDEMHSRRSGEPPRFRVTCAGSRQPLNPLVREDVCRIGRKAVINAFRHAHARNIAVDIMYRSNALRVVVRDDGCGIDPQSMSFVARQWGLSCMREDAERIGARLRLWSAPRRGTELELSVPGRLAYQPSQRASEPERKLFLEAVR